MYILCDVHLPVLTKVWSLCPATCSGVLRRHDIYYSVSYVNLCKLEQKVQQPDSDTE